MLWAIRQIFVPMRYLYIRHGDRIFQSKIVYDFILPVTLTLMTCSFFAWLDFGFDIFSNEDFVKKLTDLLTLMIVFYLAALAAVATFDRRGIDEPLRGGDATLKMLNHTTNTYVVKKLTYRQFISYLFGYLSFLSLIIYVFIMLTTLAWPALKTHYCHNDAIMYIVTTIINPAMCCLLSFGLWQLIVTSLLGIYFLTERIQSLNDAEN